MNEEILKASHSIGFTVADLQAALKRANAVEAIVLLELIDAAVTVQRRIQALAEAVKLS